MSLISDLDRAALDEFGVGLVRIELASKYPTLERWLPSICTTIEGASALVGRSYAFGADAAQDAFELAELLGPTVSHSKLRLRPAL